MQSGFTLQARVVSWIALVAGCTGACTPARGAGGAGGEPLTPVRQIPLPQITGGTNHLAADEKRQLVFVTAPGDKLVVVADLESGKAVRAVKTPGAAAAAFAPDLKQLCVSGAGAVAVYDGESFAEAGRIELGHNLDELAYDAAEQRLYAGVMDPDAAAIAIIDLPNRKVLGQVKLPGKPQGFVLEERGSLIFANVPSAGLVAVVDRKAQKLVTTWRVSDARGNYPVALDEEHHRLFVGCRQPARVLVLDTEGGKTVASVPSGEDADDMSYDPGSKRVYMACGEGNVTVIQQDDADHYHRLPDVRTAEGSRNSLLAAGLRRFFVALPAKHGKPAELRVYDVTGGK